MISLRETMYEGDLLIEGALALEEAETGPVAVSLPHVVSLADVASLLGKTDSRRVVLHHLSNLVRWVAAVTQGDEHSALWVRGTFASTLWTEAQDLDVVLICAKPELLAGDAWLLTILDANPAMKLHPGQFTLTVVDYTDSESLREQAMRSGRAVRDPVTGDALRTGWLSVHLGGGPT